MYEPSHSNYFRSSELLDCSYLCELLSEVFHGFGTVVIELKRCFPVLEYVERVLGRQEGTVR